MMFHCEDPSTFADRHRIAMNLLDIVLIIILLASMIYSGWRGFVRDVFSILAIIGGILFASHLYTLGASFLARWIADPPYARIAGFVLIFILAGLLICLAGSLLRKIIRMIHLGWLDRWAGVAFGLIKGVIITAVVVLALVAFLPPKSEILGSSKLSPYFIQLARGATTLVPDGLKSLFEKGQKDLKKYWKNKDMVKKVVG
jgi:membrane protein required for colicin V production